MLGLTALAASLATVFCAAMIYGVLKPVRQWQNIHTAPGYLICAIFSGATLLELLHAVVFGEPGTVAAAAASAAADRLQSLTFASRAARP